MSSKALCAMLLPAAAAALGGSADVHGCYASAGYAWCESSAKCVRSWEEGCATAAETVATTTTTKPSGKPVIGVGGGKDEGGCCTGCGYSWCEEMGACVQIWLVDAAMCPTLFSTIDEAIVLSSRRHLLGGGTDSNGCLTSAGYTWCESSAKCLRVWEEGCSTGATAATTTTKPSGDKPPSGGGGKGDRQPIVLSSRRGLQIGGGTDGNGCLSSAGYTWCESSGKCLRLWEEGCATADSATTTKPSGDKPIFVGGQKDEHGCCTGCGYTWCEEMGTCVQAWMVDATMCPTLFDKIVLSS